MMMNRRFLDGLWGIPQDFQIQNPRAEGGIRWQ